MRPAATIVAALTVVWLTTAIAAASPGASVTLARIAGQPVHPSYAEVVRLGQVVPVTGTVAHRPAHASIQLQGRTTAAWHVLLTASAPVGAFTVHWHVRARVVQVRVALFSGRRRIATSTTAQLLVGSAIVPCHPAAPPATLPVGDGWIDGGVYLLGGPAPGLDECEGTSSTITATSSSGGVISQTLVGGNGYALVVPAGTYQLQDGECRGTATVTAGQRTVANTDCDFP